MTADDVRPLSDSEKVDAAIYQDALTKGRAFDHQQARQGHLKENAPRRVMRRTSG